MGPKAKAGGIEPPSTVLETVILPLNYANVNHNSNVSLHDPLYVFYSVSQAKISTLVYFISMKKICPQCKNKLPVNSKYFHQDARNPTGFRGDCKKCRLKKSKIKASDPLAKKKKAEYRKQTRDHIREYKRNWEQQRAKTHPEFRIKQSLRGRIFDTVKHGHKSDKTMNLLGCSIEYFIAYLQSKFQAGMTLDNYGEWHIDHIRPCASFDLTCPMQQRVCFHYTNLQPLWAKDNLLKSDKY